MEETFVCVCVCVCVCFLLMCRTLLVLWVSVCRTSVVGVTVCRDKYCGCQCTGQVCGCQCAGPVLWVSVCRTRVVGVSVQSCMVVCKKGGGGFAERKRVCHTHVLLLAGRWEPIRAPGALQDKLLNQQPSFWCYLFWSGYFLVYLSGVFWLVQPCGRTMWAPSMTTYWHLQNS
jgi:hypothetical protein